MDNHDQRRTHNSGHESHGVHLCHKCGWPFPNPHPSAKNRRAHKKICGTIEGYKLCVSEGQTHLNASDDERLSGDDHKTAGPIAFDTGNNDKGRGGIGEKIIRSEDEAFSDAVAYFFDSALGQGIKEPLHDSLDSATHVETVEIKYPKSSRSSEDFAADGSQLIVKSRDESQTQNPKILRSDRIGDENTLELHGQLSGSTVDPFSSYIPDLRTEESTVVHSDICFRMLSHSHPNKAEAIPDVLPQNKIYAGENVTDCGLTSVAKEINMKGKDETESDRDMVEIVVSPDKLVGEMCEGVSKVVVSDVVMLDCQVADGAFDLNENNSAELLSVLPQNDLPLEVNSIVITNASTNSVQLESAHVIQCATYTDFKMLQGKGKGDCNVLALSTCDDRPDVAHPQSEYEDFKDHERVLSQNPLSLHSSEALKHEQDDLKDAVTAENNFLFNPSQLSEKSEVLSPDMHVLDSRIKKDQVNWEPMAEEMHAEESIGVSPVKLTVESNQGLDKIGASMNSMKAEMNKSHMVHFSEEQASDHVCQNSQQLTLPEGRFMVSSNKNPGDASFGSATSETTSIISTDNMTYEKNRKGTNDVDVDGKCGGANVENDTGIRMKTLQTSDLFHWEVKLSSKSDDAGETGKSENSDMTDIQYTKSPTVKDTSFPKSADSHFECPIISDVAIDGSERKSIGVGHTIRGPLSGAQEDIKNDEINSNSKVNEECNRFVGPSADSHQARDAELLFKAAEDLARKTSLSSLNIEPSAQHVSAVEINDDGELDREVSAITVVPVQDQSGNNLVTLGSSGIDTSVDSGSRCDSLEGNWGSVSVLSMQSDAQAVIDTEALPSADLLASTEAGKSSLNNPKATSERQQFENPEMFEPPSFMTLVEPGLVVGPKAAASEVQKGLKPQQSISTSSQAGWFPTLTQVTNESPGRKKNEEIIARATNRSTTKQHIPLKSLLGEAAHNNKLKSPKVEENSVTQKNGKVPEDNGSGLTTVNSILVPESPAAQTVKGEGGKEWNSPARYPVDIKREKRRVKSRPYWIQFVCCSSVDPRRR